MDIRIAGAVNDSIVDGPGLRYTVFTQGCPHHCPGCHNPNTHAFDGGRVEDTDALIAAIRENPLLDGLTLSGGEPFCQPEACALLAEAAKARGLNVWAYTGYTLETLRAMHDRHIDRLLNSVDVLVDGRFELAERSLDLYYCGSRNQRLIDMNKTKEQGGIILWTPPVW